MTSNQAIINIPGLKDVAEVLGLEYDGPEGFTGTITAPSGLSISIKCEGGSFNSFDHVAVNFRTHQRNYQDTVRRKVYLHRDGYVLHERIYRDSIPHRPLTDSEKKKLKAKYVEMVAVQNRFNEAEKARVAAHRKRVEARRVLFSVLAEAGINIDQGDCHQSPQATLRVGNKGCSIHIDLSNKTPDQIVAIYADIRKTMEKQA